MEPLINPWLIYLIGISSNISWIASTIIISCFIGFGLAFVMALGTICWIADNSVEEENYSKVFSQIGKFVLICATTLTVSSIFKAFIPEQKWLIALAVNSQITEKNISTGAQVTADIYKQFRADFFDLVDKVVDAPQESKSENKE